MKAYLLPHQARFFQKRGWIIFDPLFQEDFYSSLKTQLEKLCERKSLKNFSELSFEDCYKLSYENLSSISAIQEIFHHKQLIQILQLLLEVDKMRMGFSQIWSSSHPITNFINEPTRSLSSLQPLLASVIICLEDIPEGVVEEEKFFCLPLKKGQMAIVKSSYDKVFNELAKLPQFCYLHLGYSDYHSRFFVNEKDPNTNFLKTLGYAAGDIIQDRSHPSLHA
jgi:hypothetical protein